MYPADWHRIYGDRTGQSARAILPPIVELFDISSVVEVGCGNAHWTQAAIDAGATDYTVVDGPWNDRTDLLVDKDRFVTADLAVPLELGRRYDLAICLEVAEHVAAPHADKVVKSLTDHADIILFGAAIPFQGGYGHINEQWPSWWREKFEAAGYEAFDLVRPRVWEDRSLHYWYRQNAFVYVRRSDEGAIAKAAADERTLYHGRLFFDAVHPEKFEEVASYEAIAMKRLLRRLPSWIGMRVKQRLGRA